jgi:hypothetical protein
VIPLGHVGGMPVEEFLPWLAGPGTGLFVARAWISMRLRKEGKR